MPFLHHCLCSHLPFLAGFSLLQCCMRGAIDVCFSLCWHNGSRGCSGHCSMLRSYSRGSIKLALRLCFEVSTCVNALFLALSFCVMSGFRKVCCAAGLCG